MGILYKLVAAAAADSVNPCTFYIFAALLLALSARSKSVRDIAFAAAAFIAGVYVGYYLLGLGIAVAGSRIPKTLFAAIALAYGGITIANAVHELTRGRPLTPKPARMLSGRTVRAASIAAAGALGFTLSFTLLPCSGGPLVAFIYAASSEGYNLAAIALLLLLYNIIFVAPLVAIALAFMLAHKYIAPTGRSRLQALLELAAGIVIIAIVFSVT